MPEEVAPPVVAVVVAADPGPWLERCLDALDAQDYPNLTTVVIDAASEPPLARRVAAVTPGFYLARLEDNRGYGPSANAVLGLTEGATHFLFCHDDVVLDPDAVRHLVEESFRSNAGIVGPKLVDDDEPDRILQFGLEMDRFGAPVRRVERREFDQAQHDEPREVFAVPGGCMLVRADLFSAIGGFDREISMFGEDIDLSWRARIAGARVTVTPSAIVRHLEAAAAGRRQLPEARALEWRHELRAVLKNYGPGRRQLVLAELAVLSLLEVAYFALVGRRVRVHQVVDAWRWNLAKARHLRQARAAVAATRRLPDRLVMRLTTVGSFRLVHAAEQRIEQARGRRLGGHQLKAPRPDGRPRQVTVAAVVCGLVLLFGSRLLVFGHIPLLGGYLPIPSPSRLLADYLGGSRGAGSGPVGPVSPAYAILGLAGLVAFSAMGVVLKVAMILAVTAGAFGAARLVRPLGPPLARLCAAVAYLFLPLCWDDLARGDLQALVVYGAMPYLLLRLAKATGIPPYGDKGAVVWSWRTAEEGVSLGVLLGFAAALAPVVVLATAVCAVALVVSSAAAGHLADAFCSIRVLVVTAVAVAVAFVLCFPWSLTFVQPGARWSAFAGVAPARAPELSALARFDLGPIGHGPLAYGLFAAALFVLVVGGGGRFSWATRLWGVGLADAAVAWAAARGWLGAGGGETAALVVPAAVCVSGAVGLGVASVRREVSRARLGWRHVAAGIFVLVGLAGMLPVLAETADGRWTLPGTGYDTVFSGIAEEAGGRVLWLGDPRALPPSGWQVRPGVEVALTSRVLPQATALFAPANPGRVVELVADVSDAELGRTVELGRLLAEAGVGLVVVPSAFAPRLAGVQMPTPTPPPPGLLAALSRQQDLRQVPSEGGAAVFENADFAAADDASVGAAAPAGATPAAWRVLGVAGACCAWAGTAALALARRRRRRLVPAHAEGVPATPPEHEAELVGAGAER